MDNVAEAAADACNPHRDTEDAAPSAGTRRAAAGNAACTRGEGRAVAACPRAVGRQSLVRERELPARCRQIATTTDAVASVRFACLQDIYLSVKHTLEPYNFNWFGTYLC